MRSWCEAALDSQGSAAAMQARDDGADGADGSPGGQRNPGAAESDGGPGGAAVPWGPGGQARPDSEGAAGDATAEPVAAEPVLQGAGPAGDAASAAVEPGGRVLQFTLTVPFRSPLEADMARRSLAPDAPRYLGVVHKELAVHGSSLVVRWTAEDPVLFRISINSFLDQLSLVIRNIRRMGIAACAHPGRGKGPKV
ncbi:EKC/KEOPS complex subunit LAGE3 [Galemys pyrenaicus]|uniref:L antigen family member 3 n=1 Tax=Galemys pyrenaicus TaxID=202257 RepID=A0A8J6ALN6_GALPY|nr:EKC/KEOPS complex subunit LAGE3 [Galemys pyrenaicus]